MRTRKQRQRGAETVEAALVTTVFLMVLMGIMDFGRLVWMYGTLTHATREAARYAMAHGSESSQPASSADIAAVVNSQAIGLDSSSIVVTPAWSPDNRPGSTVTVTVQYNFSPLPVPYTKIGTLVLRSVSQQVISY